MTSSRSCILPLAPFPPPTDGQEGASCHLSAPVRLLSLQGLSHESHPARGTVKDTFGIALLAADRAHLRAYWWGARPGKASGPCRVQVGSVQQVLTGDTSPLPRGRGSCFSVAPGATSVPGPEGTGECEWGRQVKLDLQRYQPESGQLCRRHSKKQV